MKTKSLALCSSILLISLFCTPFQAECQADPEWLRSWNEANESRPPKLNWRGRIASKDEPGQPFIIRAQVLQPDGSPAAGVVVHAYHRDRDGFDFGPKDKALTTWRLQGWVQTDTQGRFEFHTIRPAPDHLGREGAHIHITTVSRKYGRQWAPTVYLADDPLVKAEEHQRSEKAGQFAWVRNVELRDGIQYIDHKIRLREKADF